MHVKRTILLRNWKVTKYWRIVSQNMKQKKKWIKAIPNANLRVSKDTVVCALHWPSGFEEIKVNGKSRPKDPPSIWPGVPSSQVPTSCPPPRPTKKASSSIRSVEEHELSEILSSDKVTFKSLKENLLKKSEGILSTFVMFYYRIYILCSISAIFKWSTSFSC